MKKTMQRVFLACCLVPLAACSSSSGTTDTGRDGGPAVKDGAVTSDTGAKSDGGTKTDGGSKGDSGGGTSPADTYCTQFVAAEAKAAAQCLGGLEADWAAQLGTSTFCTEVGAAVAAGSVKYDATEGSSCLTALANVDCATVTTVNSQPAACTAALTGMVATGGACHANLDCGATDYCSGLGGASASCSGTCAAQLTTGTSCTASDVCAEGSACAGSPLVCTTIPAPVAKGATCLYDSSTKKAAPACQLGLACNLSSFTCVEPIAPGDPCAPGQGECAPFTYCDPTSKTCKADPTTGGKCGDVAGEDPIPCIGQTYCKGASTTATNGVCAALIAGGASCESTLLAPVGGQCASGSCSVTDGGVGACAAVCTQE
jgi:hypothetical protein